MEQTETVPGSHWTTAFELALASELKTVRGVGPTSATGQAVLQRATTLFEEITARLSSEADDKNSALGAELEAVNLTVRLLEDQIEFLREQLRAATRAESRKRTAAVLAALGALLLAISTGAAEGIAGRAFDGGSASPTQQMALHCAEAADALAAHDPEETATDKLERMEAWRAGRDFALSNREAAQELYVRAEAGIDDEIVEEVTSLLRLYGGSSGFPPLKEGDRPTRRQVTGFLAGAGTSSGLG